jgi:mono/diheme cytochrome c family protein
VAALLSSKCITCHGSTPLTGAPTSLVTYADLTTPSKSDPTQTNAALAVSRMMSTTNPMPPAGSTPATAAEIAAMQSWIAAGYPTSGCGTGSVPDPFAVAPTCTSKVTWTRGTSGSALMEPGLACTNCHASSGGEAPRFAVAGTVYPTAHEPDLCNGANGTNGARVVITGANGASVTLTPNAAGNFYYEGTIATPYSAKVTYMGRERDMGATQTSGDCNACHTQNGTMSAPGRILLP